MCRLFKFLILTIIICFVHSCANNKKNKIQIGSIQVLTGQMSKYGKTLEAALKSYSEVVNEERKKKGFPQFEIITFDSKLEPKTGVSAFNQLIHINKVPVVIGALGSSVTLAMSPIAEENKVVLISPASGSPEISNAGEYIFRTCPSDIYEAEFIAGYFEKEHTGKSIAILYINNDYGIGLKNGFLNKLKNKPEGLLSLAIEQGQNDFRNLLAKIKSASSEVIYIIGYEEMITIFKQAKEMDIQARWLGNNQLNDQSMIDKMGNTANGTIFPGHEYELDKVKQKYPKFYAKYLEYSNNQELDIFAAYGVDALMLIEDALNNGAKTGEEIKTHLSKVKGFEGLTGVFDFDSSGDPIRTLNLYIINEGVIEKINN